MICYKDVSGLREKIAPKKGRLEEVNIKMIADIGLL
jgi:hypothetical protein